MNEPSSKPSCLGQRTPPTHSINQVSKCSQSATNDHTPPTATKTTKTTIDRRSFVRSFVRCCLSFVRSLVRRKEGRSSLSDNALTLSARFGITQKLNVQFYFCHFVSRLVVHCKIVFIYLCLEFTELLSRVSAQTIKPSIKPIIITARK